MKTTHTIYCGCVLEVPIMPNGEPLHLPYNDWDEWPTFCGPGSGIGDKIVPDKIFGVPVNVACYIHDTTEGLAESREEDHQSNVMFRKNLEAIIEHLEPKPTWEDKHHHARYYRAMTYYAAVDIVGLRDDIVKGEPI